MQVPAKLTHEELESLLEFLYRTWARKIGPAHQFVDVESHKYEMPLLAQVLHTAHAQESEHS